MIAEAAVALALLAPAQEQPCQTHACEARVQRRHMRRVVQPHLVWLRRTATCESSLGTGRPKWHLNTHNGYFGGLQFSLKSWRYVGGKGYPHLAPKLEQMYRGVRLLAKQGRGAWPVCG
jgi:Transglycosylase-like domain